MAGFQRRDGPAQRASKDGARDAGDAGKLSLQMRDVSDLLKESSYWAEQSGSPVVRADDVQRALDARIARADRVRDVLITGDFFVTPPRTIFDLEAALRGVALVDIGAAVERFFTGADVGLLSVAPGDFARAIEAAAASRR